VNLGTLGLNLGMQGVQFTATSTVAENQTLSNPVYVHSIPTNNDNQDIVSMGTNSALMAMKVIDNTFEVLAIELIALLQAVDYLEYAEKLSPANFSVYTTLRKIVPAFKEDSPKYNDIRRVINFIKSNDTTLKRKDK
jgi:histidine ammonia-lyase